MGFVLVDDVVFAFVCSETFWILDVFRPLIKDLFTVDGGLVQR